MSTVIRPVGPLPPRVYWVRRLLLIAAVVVVVALVAAAVSKIAGAGDAPTAKPTVSAAATEPSGSGGKDGQPAGGTDEKPADQSAEEPVKDGAESGGSGDVPACAQEDVGITLSADGETFQGRNVKFALEVTNTSDRSCLIDVTDKTRELVIVSGPARIWGSADCVDPKPRMLLLAAGQSDTASLTWKRVRSEPGCPTKGVEAKAGTYRATASILGKTSDEVVLVLS
ncbi:hypothetical protein HF995_03710 [Sanguibacter hominis ATCC BAA-789]|uniref:Uncharacterized protein n=1 Tax=Sanguibacter hominis ATCC BAA-789 TaxID=1312740 RepID=A0A9X5FED6_9MICO|nr:hypothetical protein [Sanguibacter hominis]NKX92386.1 hypothetical protein [Sanguibacter hominis ATCC BAA-789]